MKSKCRRGFSAFLHATYFLWGKEYNTTMCLNFVKINEEILGGRGWGLAYTRKNIVLWKELNKERHNQIVIKKIFLVYYLSLGRGEGREKERQRNMMWERSINLIPGLNPQPRHGPWLGIKLVIYCSAEWFITNWATLVRAKYIYFLIVLAPVRTRCWRCSGNSENKPAWKLLQQ